MYQGKGLLYQVEPLLRPHGGGEQYQLGVGGQVQLRPRLPNVHGAKAFQVYAAGNDTTAAPQPPHDLRRDGDVEVGTGRDQARQRTLEGAFQHLAAVERGHHRQTPLRQGDDA